MPATRPSGARVVLGGEGRARVATGVSVFDHLLTLLARHAGFDLTLEVAPGDPDEEVAAAGRALGQALAEALPEGSRRHGSAVVPADEALAHVAIEVSGRPLVVSNVDLSAAHVAGGIGPQTERVLANLRAILEAAGSGLDRLVKTTVYLANLDDFGGMNEVYTRYVDDRPPARATVEVARLPSGALVEIEAVAH